VGMEGQAPHPGRTWTTRGDDLPLDTRMHQRKNTDPFNQDHLNKGGNTIKIFFRTTITNSRDPTPLPSPCATLPHPRHWGWKQKNMLMAVESFFQTNAYHPFATCGNINCRMTDPIPMSRIITASTPGQLSQTRTIKHFCAAENCFQMDITNFRSTRHLKKDKSFLDKAGIFDFSTIAEGEIIRDPYKHFDNLQCS